jgi:hypothetical protein
VHARLVVIGAWPLLLSCGGAAGAIDGAIAVTDAAAWVDARSEGSFDAPQGCPEPTTRICVVHDPASYMACLGKVNGGTIDEIQIEGTISCALPGECVGRIEGIDRPIRLVAATEGAGFRRTGGWDGPIFAAISASGGVTISGLSFDEGKDLPCSGTCYSTLGFFSVTGVTLEDIEVKWSKDMGIQLWNSSRVRLRDSRLHDTAKFGIWIYEETGLVSRDVRIENNTFDEIRSNAIYGALAGTEDAPSVISGNQFIHNHRMAVFSTCGAGGNEPCEGGQLDIVHNTDHLVIENNVIRDGKIDAHPGLGASGIEFDFGGFGHVLIRHNDIHTHTGWGIYVNEPRGTIGPVTIENNRLYANTYCGVYFPDATTSDNCLQSSCAFVPPTGVITAAPNPCTLGSGRVCSTTSPGPRRTRPA